MSSIYSSHLGSQYIHLSFYLIQKKIRAKVKNKTVSFLVRLELMSWNLQQQIICVVYQKHKFPSGLRLCHNDLMIKGQKKKI